MKKKKTYIPLPEGCDTFRSSWILGLTVASLDMAMLGIAMCIPFSLCFAWDARDSRLLFIMLIPLLLLILFYSLIGGIVLLFSRLLGKPRVGILDGQIHLTDRKRSIPLERIVSIDLYLGYQGRSSSQPPKVTLSLPHEDTFEITRPSIRLLRILRASCPRARFTMDWKEHVRWNGGIGLVGGVIAGIAVFCL